MSFVDRHWLRRLVGFLWVCAAALSGGCVPGRDLPPLPPYQASAYRLGGGDQLRVITYGEDQLTGEFRVDDQGRIAMPLLGGVQAGGLTPQQLEQALASELRRRNLMRDPSVSVEVLAYRPIFVLGEVAKPGQYPYQPGMTVLTSAAVAGGFTYRAVQDYAAVIRTTNGRAVEGLARPDTFLAPGDVVKVFERRF
jgi:polysaccharide export outer membrane protein